MGRLTVGKRSDRRSDPSYVLSGLSRGVGPVVGVIDEVLVLVRVAPKQPGNDMRVPVHDLVERIGRSWQRVGSIPAGQDMTHHVCPRTVVFAFLQFFSEESEETKVVWLGRIDESEDVGSVPEISVESDDLEIRSVLNRVCTVMSVFVNVVPVHFYDSLLGYACCLVIDPAFLLPELGEMIVIPTELLLELAIESGRGVKGLLVRIVVSNRSIQWCGRVQSLLPEIVQGYVSRSCQLKFSFQVGSLTRLGVFDVAFAELVIWVVRDQVPSKDGHVQHIIRVGTGEDWDGLDGSGTESPRSVT